MLKIESTFLVLIKQREDAKSVSVNFAVFVCAFHVAIYYILAFI